MSRDRKSWKPLPEERLKSQVRLPVIVPTIHCFMFDAYPLAIMEQYPVTSPYIFSNYTQLIGEHDFLHHPIKFRPYVYDWTLSPWLKVHKLERDVFGHYFDDPIKFTVDAVEQGYYVYLYVDEYYLPNKPWYQTQHFWHECLIHGFDRDTETVDMFGYDSIDTSWQFKFQSSKVSNRYFRQALDMTGVGNLDFGQMIYLIRFDNTGQYSFDVKLVGELLEEFRFSKNSSLRYRSFSNPIDAAFGMATYEKLKEWLEALINNEVQDDFKHFQVLLEHKTFMTKRVAFMQRKGFIGNNKATLGNFKAVESKADVMRNLFLMYKVSGRKEILSKLQKKFDSLARDEARALDDLLLQMQAHTQTW